MMRVPRRQLNEAIEFLLIAAHSCTDTAGLRVIFHPGQEQAEAVVLAALSILAAPAGPVTPSDVFFLSGFGTDSPESWPKLTKEGANHG